MASDPGLALKAVFETANWYSELSVILVVFGVFIEFLALLVWAKEMSRSEKIVMVLATFVVAAGCGGEWLFGGRAMSAARQLTDIADNKAAKANREAGELGVDVTNLKAFVDRQKNEVRASLATLQSTEAALDTAIKAANERLASRDLSGDRLNAFVSSLSKFSGTTIDIWVSGTGDMLESTNLARLIANALLQARWRPSITVGSSAISPGTTVGMNRLLTNGAPSTELQTKASALRNALELAQLKPYPKVDPNIAGLQGDTWVVVARVGGPSAQVSDPSPLILVVGPKPEFW